MHNSIVTTQSTQSPFDSIRHFNEHGSEFWNARELMALLGYQKWIRFTDVIEKAKISFSINPMGDIENHISDSEKMVKRSQGGGSRLSDFKLSRYFCYLIAMNGDPRKPEIASAQSYFAVKTRESETVIPAQSEKLRELELVNQNLKLQSEILKMAGHICDFHSPAIALALMGRGDCIVKQETIVTEIVEPDTGNTTKILTADQLKKAVKDRTGQKLKSLKTFVDSLREAGRDDLLIPVKRSHVAEYPIPEKLDEAIAVVYGKCRQKLIGEN